MDQFINDRNALVTDAIEGVLSSSGTGVARLDGYPHIKVVVRTDHDRGKVALVSGGGSGHEPSHAGFVGRGMLTAAVCGEVFASPSVEAVLAGILAVSGDVGCLLIVKNYTGDRLNFGLAAERARALGHQVRMVIVDDDIAIPDAPQARGLAGTLFVHKIAGALAEQGADLDTVADTAQRVIDNTLSIGMALDTCTIPGSNKEQRLSAGKAELGLGIHGEPGVEQVDFSGARQAVTLLVDKLGQHLAATENRRSQVALINNLGGCTQLEMSILTKELLHSCIGEHIGWVIGPASLMTSLDMHGFSVSLLDVSGDDDLRAALLTEAAPRYWPGCSAVVAQPEVLPVPEGLSPSRPAPSAHEPTRTLIDSSCAILIGAEAELNALDAKSGDGDTGSTLATAARALRNRLDDMPLADTPQLLHSLAAELSQTMGGSSGVLLAIFFAAAGDAASRGSDLQQALQAGLARMQQIGGASPGDRTMIDALAPALEVLDQGLAEAARAARHGADATAGMTCARAGRASYVSEANLVGHIDPGAEAVARLLEQLAM